MPIASVILLLGFPAIGLERVSTAQWGGVLVTIVVAAVGIVASLPLGIILALGRRSRVPAGRGCAGGVFGSVRALARRSRMPAVRVCSVVFIDFVRGVPLITVLFMASVMLPLFVPETW